MANPFKVLGLTPDIVKKAKSDENVLALAKSNFRTLSKIFHPDKGGSAREFGILSDAMVELEDPEGFFTAKREYLTSRKSQIQSLLIEIASQKAITMQVTRQLLEYLQSLSLNGGLPLRGNRLLLNYKLPDSRWLILSEESRGVLTTQEIECWGESPEYYDLTPGKYFLDDGSLIIVRGKEKSRSAQLYKPKGSSKVLSAVILGSFSPSFSIGSELNSEEEKHKRNAIEGLSVVYEETSKVDSYRFEEALPFIHPFISIDDSLLVAFSDETSFRLSLLGSVKEIIVPEVEPSGLR